MNFIGFYDYTVVLTYISMVSAVLGIIQTTKGNLNIAIICLMISGICDAFDGTVARTKKNRTDDEKMFGIQLDSLCDVISFGVFPAMICYYLGVNGVIGTALIVCYCLCALIRLAFFNVLETSRQKTEGGSNKFYRGLPVTSASMIFPFVYVFKFILAESFFVGLLHVVVAVTAFLFILDFKVKKIQLVKTKH